MCLGLGDLPNDVILVRFGSSYLAEYVELVSAGSCDPRYHVVLMCLCLRDLCYYVVDMDCTLCYLPYHVVLVRLGSGYWGSSGCLYIILVGLCSHYLYMCRNRGDK